ncbi:hypothetical protein ACSX1A_14295 [Pontibacter sp. MBLB2868]|uniref:hypothetical protein n=1 Tax=Pontibacter sp. MBLB2868 TaxID=3451555 RepID=UPI003F7539EC
MITRLVFLTITLAFSIASCTTPAQQSNYSIIGIWKLVDMQFEGGAKDMSKTLSQSNTKFVYEASGEFKMMLDADGRGLQGGYFYDPESSILSIKYGTQIDTALVSWVNSNKMIQTTKDGKTRTILERVKN